MKTTKTDIIKNTLKKFKVEPALQQVINEGYQSIMFRGVTGQCGTTNLINNLCFMLSKKGITVAVVDLHRLGRNKVLCPAPKYSINEYYLLSTMNIQNYLNKTRYPNVKFIGYTDSESLVTTVPRIINDEFIDKRQIRNKTMLAELNSVFDLVIIDGAEFMDDDTLIFSKLVDHQFLLTEYSSKAVDILDTELTVYSEVSKKNISLIVINRMIDIHSKETSLLGLPIFSTYLFCDRMEQNIYLGKVYLELEVKDTPNSSESQFIYLVKDILKTICLSKKQNKEVEPDDKEDDWESRNYF